MGTITIEMQGAIAVLTLADGVTNAVGSQMTHDLAAALEEAAATSRGLVLAGNDTFFSMGFNLPELIQLDRQGMRAFIHAFERATLDLFTLPLPTAAAIEGHAIAGGTILGLAADFRIAAAGKKLMGLNEIKLGIPVPCLALMMLEQTVSRPVAQEMLYHGEFVKAEQALDTGLVDEVVAPGFAVERALARLASIAAHPGGAFRAMKAARVEIIRDKFERTYVEQHERFLDCWFQADTRVLLEEAAEKFRKGA